MWGLDNNVLYLFDFLIYDNRALFNHCESWLEDADLLVDFVLLGDFA
jgi:hypothetical protein